MNYRAPQLRIAPVSLALLAALSGACSSIESDYGASGADTNASNPGSASLEIAAVVCSGHVHVPLAVEASYWPRARSVAALHAVLAATATAGGKLKHPVQLGFGPAVALVDDPEQHRLALIERWLARARELATRAQAQGLCGALHLRECAVPGAVSQHPRNLDEVELRLALDGPLIATPAGE